MTVSQIMRHPAVTIPATASIVAAAVRMRDRCSGILAVIDKGRLAGVITDRDIVIRCVAANHPPQESRVADFMTRDVRTCLDSQAIEEAAAVMGDTQVRRLPVYDSSAELVGMLSLDRIAEDGSERLAGETLGEIVEER